MSGLAAIWHLDGAPVEPRELDRITSTLAHRGIDGQSTWVGAAGSLALGHLHFWTTPEEVGERQPVLHGQTTLMLDGRIDNRVELGDSLGIAGNRLRSLSDAHLAALAFERWGEGFMSRLVGPMAIVLWDGRSRRLLCGRDALGRRTAFYRFTRDAIYVASEPGAITDGDPRTASLDPVFLAHYYGRRRAPEGRTLFESVRELQAGEMIEVANGVLRTERLWPAAMTPIRYRAREDYAHHFAELLDRAVARRMRSVAPPAVLMSGGLDSTSIAAVAARRLKSRSDPSPLRVYSFVFDTLTDLDERAWMAPMVEMYGLDQQQVLGDDAWPLSDLASWQWDPSGPAINIFGALNDRLYTASRTDGARVLLTGTAADVVLGHANRSWLGDLIADGHLKEAVQQVSRHVLGGGLWPVLHSGSLRRALARLAQHRSRPEQPAPWLLPSAAALIQPREGIAGIDGIMRQGIDARALLDSLDLSHGFGTGRPEHRAKVELRDPFADRDLVEFALSIPAYVLYNRGEPKHLLRTSLGSVLPPEILSRPRRSHIGSLFWRGMGRAVRGEVEHLLGGLEATWPEYVRQSALESYRFGRVENIDDGALLWSSVLMEWWLVQRLQSLAGVSRERISRLDSMEEQ